MKIMYATMMNISLILCLCGTALACEEDPGISLQVKYIGPVCVVGGSDWLFAELAKKPEKALCALVKQLNTTSVKEIHSWEGEKKMHAFSQIMRIRALRLLTCGQDFTATTPYNPDQIRGSEDYWNNLAGVGPRKNKKGDQVEVPFFLTRMAWGIDYIAPIEAQKDIIRQWREWQAKNGTNAGCTPNVNDWDQYWF